MSGFPDVRIVSADACERAVDVPALLDEIARGFVDYSAGRVAVPPVGHLGFDDPPGDLHVKYGHVRGDDVFVIEVATGFPRNVERGLPTGDGAMLVLDAHTGLLRAILLDHARLTDLRTAAAGAVAARSRRGRGAVAARALARRAVQRVGVLGGGVQARLQLRMLAQVTSCREVLVWNRTRERADALAAEAARLGCGAHVAPDAATVAAHADLLVTTTAARAPLFPADVVRPGTHVTAVGADAPGKQELDPTLLGRADLVVVDSRAQCADDAVTVCDLTGVAVQDIVVARHVLARA